jgi:hypothetical protein
MTWSEFKEEVDKYLSDNSIPDNVTVDWIDSHMPSKGGLEVSLNVMADSITITNY